MHAITALNTLVDEKLCTGQEWGSGPPYHNIPNQAAGMKIESMNESVVQAVNPQSYPGVPSQVAAPQPPTSAYQARGLNRTDVIHCNKQFVGRIIGSKGSTIKDLQQRSGTRIQIKQDVPIGTDCEVMITGSNEGVEMAKQMVQQIIR